MKKIQNTLLLLLFSNTLAYSEVKIPYEQCNWTNKDYTEHIIENSKKVYYTEEETEACIDCLYPSPKEQSRFDSFMRSFVNADKSNQIPEICFFASSIRSTEKKGGKSSRNYYYCKEPTSKRPSRSMTVFNPDKKRNQKKWARRTCLSKNYMDMTIQSFNYMTNCFGISDLKEKKELFTIFNHESSFILNNRSETDARCYGQLTEDAIDQMDKMIYSKEKSHEQYTVFYKQALKNCPDLKEKLIIPKMIIEETSAKPSTTKLGKLQDKTDPTCRVSQHPHTCFFYSIFHFVSNKVRFERNVNFVANEIPYKEDEKVVTNRDALIKDFKLPITLTKILRVKGVFTKKNGKRVKADWIFQDDHALYKSIKNLTYDPQQIKVQKIDLYRDRDMDKINTFTTHTAHNGGASVIVKHFEEFIRKQKEQISVASFCDRLKSSKLKICKHRKQIMNYQPLSFKDFSTPFSDHLKANYGKAGTSSKRRLEVGNFYKHLLKNKDYLKNKDNFLASQLTRLHKNNPNVSPEDIEAFVKESKKQCSDF